MKLCVKTAQLLPHSAPDHQKGSSRLIHLGGLRKVQVQVSITAVRRVPRKQAVDPEDFEPKNKRRGKTPDREPSLDLATGIQQLSGCQPNGLAATSCRQRVHRSLQLNVGVQQQDQFGVQRRDALIGRTGEAAVGAVGDQLHRRSAAHQFHGVVPGSVVYDYGVEMGAGIQAALNDIARVVGHHYYAGSIHVRAKYSLQYRSNPVNCWISRISCSLDSTIAMRLPAAGPRAWRNWRIPSSLP